MGAAKVAKAEELPAPTKNSSETEAPVAPVPAAAEVVWPEVGGRVRVWFDDA